MKRAADMAVLFAAGVADQLVAELQRAFEAAVAALIAWLVSLVGVPG